MVGTGPHEYGNDVLRAVRPGEAAALVRAFQQAQDAEATVRTMLARCGIPAASVTTVATLDDDGRPVVRLTLSIDDREHC